MQNRFLVGVITLSGISSLLHFVGLLSNASVFLPQSYLIFFWCSLILIVANSDMLNEIRFNRFFQALLILSGIGLLMRILHWPYGTEILMGSLVTAGLGYAYRFWEKPDKGLLDILKLLWVLAEIVEKILRFNHLPGAQQTSYAAGVLFLAMLAVFLYLGLREGWLLSPSENAEMDDQNTSQ
ncbi:MAG: hypothetical protein AAFN10_12710 [Bacteroidota bacterium]